MRGRNRFISLLLALTAHAMAQELPQVMIRGDFVSVPKKTLAEMRRETPDLSISAATIQSLLKAGKATVRYAPTVLTRCANEATSKSVQEVLYPQGFDVDWAVPTNAGRQVTSAAVITPAVFETKETGVIFTCAPFFNTQRDVINLTIHAELVSSPVWKTFPAVYVDASGTAHTIAAEQPFFHTETFDSQVSAKNGKTILACGGVSDLEKQNETFLLLTAQFVDDEAHPMNHVLSPRAKLNPFDTVANLVYTDQLHRRIKDADRIVVRDGGDICCVSPEETLKQPVLFEVTDADELANVYRNLKFTPELIKNDCMCCGQPGIDWYKGTNRVLLTAWKHGRGLMSCGTIASFTPESQAWMTKWLQSHGLNDLK